MNDDQPTGVQRYAAWTLEDAQLRLQYQHEFSLAGLKALILINGSAIIGLLTYAGNASSKVAAGQLQGAFTSYVAGLVLGVLSYIGAYLSKAEFMQVSTLEGQQLLGIPSASGRTSESYRRVGTWVVRFAVACAFFSLVGFVAGSGYAMKAVTHRSEPTHAPLIASKPSVPVK